MKMPRVLTPEIADTVSFGLVYSPSWLPQFSASIDYYSIDITDANALRPAGSTWTVPGSVTATVAPAAGRVLYGNVEVRTDTLVLVGRGDVIVEEVTGP